MTPEQVDQIFSVYQRRGAKTIEQKSDGSLIVGWTDSAFTQLSDDDVQAALNLVASFDYRQLRQAVYPPIGDQLDAIMKGGQALADMQAMCMAVKAKYPKGA